MREFPDVTAVMITGKSLERYRLARVAVHSFRKQSYPGKLKMLIINDGEESVLLPGTDLKSNIRELRLLPGKSLGALRNLALDSVDTPYIIQWDDDDYSHMLRVQWQVNYTDYENGEATIFKKEIHCHLQNGTAFVNNGQSRVDGFPGTMLFPVSKHRFPDKGKHEDTEFLLKYKAEGRLKVLGNPPELYIRFYHGSNTWDEAHVMQFKPGWRELEGRFEIPYVTRIRKLYGEL